MADAIATSTASNMDNSSAAHVAAEVPPIEGFSLLTKGRTETPTLPEQDDLVNVDKTKTKEEGTKTSATTEQKHNASHTPLRPRIAATCVGSSKKRSIPAPGIFSTFCSAKVLENSPPVPVGTPEVEPPTWKDAVLPVVLFEDGGEVPVSRSLYRSPASTTTQPPPYDSAALGPSSHTQQLDVSSEDMMYDPVVVESVWSEPNSAVCIQPSVSPDRHADTQSSKRKAETSTVPPPSSAAAKVDKKEKKEKTVNKVNVPRKVGGQRDTRKNTASAPHNTQAPVVHEGRSTSIPSTVHDDLTSETSAPKAAIKHTKSSQALVSQRLSTVPRKKIIVEAEPDESEDIHNYKKVVAPPGEFRLATKKRASAAAQRRAAEEIIAASAMTQPEKKSINRNTSPPKPKGFDAIVEEGKRKRQQLEEQARQKELEEEAACTFKPVISRAAQKKKMKSTDASGDDGALSYAALSNDWLERREKRIQAAHQQRLDEERAERQRRFVNHESSKLAQKRREKESNTAEVDCIFDRLNSEAAVWEKRRDKLIEQYTPLFQPHRTTVSDATRDKTNRKKSVPEQSVTSSPQDGGLGTQGTDDITATHSDTAAAERSESGARYSYFDRLYQRTTQQKARTERELEKMREEENRPVTPRKVIHRTAEEAEEHAKAMLSRDAERKARWEAKMARLEEEGKTQKESLPPRTERLAERARLRQRLKEKEEEHRDVYTNADEASNVVQTAPARSAQFELHQRLVAERKQRNIERTRQQLLQQELQECTFKPHVCEESERLAMNSRQMLADGFMDRAVLTPLRSSRERSPSQGTNLSCHNGRSPLVSREQRDMLREIKLGHSPVPPNIYQSNASTTASCCDDDDNNSTQLRDNSLELEIESLEKVLSQWRVLEKEVVVDHSTSPHS